MAERALGHLVLVVEDDRDIREIVMETLADEGYRRPSPASSWVT